jgi:hypothetical protein
VSFTAGHFLSPHLWAQKFAAADGALLWGAGHVQVYDDPAGSLQIGNFPEFVTDGSGGAVFSWYTATTPLQCRVQRVLSNGAEAFAHQGVVVSTSAARGRVSPSAAFLPASQEIVVFWNEQNLGQTQSGVYGQKFNQTGMRQWTDSGLEFTPLSSDEIRRVTTLPLGDGAMVGWINSVNFGDDPVYAIGVDGNGSFAWSSPITDVCILPTGSSRLVGALSTGGFAAFAWSGGAEVDILAQNVNPDGSLGTTTVFSDGFESGDTSAWSTTVP